MMNGYYQYDVHDSKWLWRITVDGVEVASGKCKHKKEMQQVKDSHSMVRWFNSSNASY